MGVRLFQDALLADATYLNAAEADGCLARYSTNRVASADRDRDHQHDDRRDADRYALAADRTRGTRARRSVGLARMAAAAAGAADLLPGAQRGVRDHDRPGLERQALRGRVRDAFQVSRSFLNRYEVHQVGGQAILEYWIPAEDLAALNASIVGTIEVVSAYH